MGPWPKLLPATKSSQGGVRARERPWARARASPVTTTTLLGTSSPTVGVSACLSPWCWALGISRRGGEQCSGVARGRLRDVEQRGRAERGEGEGEGQGATLYEASPDTLKALSVLCAQKSTADRKVEEVEWLKMVFDCQEEVGSISCEGMLNP